MTNSERGTVLIVVAGVLAAMFIIAVTGILIASAAAKETVSGYHSMRSRLAADSALEVCLVAFQNACERHDSADAGVSDRTATPDDDFVENLVEMYRDLTDPAEDNNAFGRTKALWIADRPGIFDIGPVTDGTRVLAFSGGAPLAGNMVNARTYVEFGAPEISVTFPATDDLPEDSYQDVGEVTVTCRLFGWGVVLAEGETLGSLIPITSSYVEATLDLEFGVAAMKEEGDTAGVYEVKVSVYLKSKPNLTSRKITGKFEGIDPDIAWPDSWDIVE